MGFLKIACACFLLINLIIYSMNIQELSPWMVGHRRELHKIPELGHKEFKTSAYLQKVLKSLGLAFQTVGTGIIVNIKGTNPTKTVGFRADIDGLPIQEQNDDIEYASRHPGVMHACGHDGHAAMLLGFAKYLTANPPKNNVVLVFQPAEEGEHGAKMMIESDLINADVFYALHVGWSLELGKLETRCMAGSNAFQATFSGTSRHASQHNGKNDAILAATEFISRAERLNKDGFLFHVGKIQGGESGTVVAEKVVITGTMRFFDKKRLEKAVKKIDTIISKIQKKHGKVEIQHKDPAWRTLPLINTPCEIEKIKTLNGYLGHRRVYGAEDFSLFIERFTGAMVWLGAKIDGGHPVHSSKFNFNEEAMPNGVQVFKELLDMHGGAKHGI